MTKNNNPYGISKREFKERLIKSSFTLFRKLKLFTNLTKIYKFESGTDWTTEVFLEFDIKKSAFGILENEIIKATYQLHYIIQSNYVASEFLDDETLDFDLTLFVKYKDGNEFEKILQDGEIEL